MKRRLGRQMFAPRTREIHYPKPPPPQRHHVTPSSPRLSAPRPPKGTPTDINIYAGASALHRFNGRIPLRVDAVDAPHLKRLIAAGWLVRDRDAFVPAPGYEDFWAQEVAKFAENEARRKAHFAPRETREPRYVADFDSLEDLIQHANRELGATHVSGDGANTELYFPRGGQYPYEKATVWRKGGYWHAQGPGARTGVSRLPAGARPTGGGGHRRAAEAPRMREVPIADPALIEAFAADVNALRQERRITFEQAYDSITPPAWVRRYQADGGDMIDLGNRVINKAKSIARDRQPRRRR